MEIEMYLVERLNEMVPKEEEAARGSPLEAKFLSLSSKFEELKNTLAEGLRKGKKPSRDALYDLLNHHLAKWKQLSEKKDPRYFSLDRLIFIWKFNQKFKQIKDGLFSEATAADHPGTEKFTEDYRWSTRSADFEVRGLDARAMSLQRLVVPRGGDANRNKFVAVGVVGMPGAGKTTLCQVIFNKDEVIKHFVPRIWVCLSKQANGCGDHKNSRKETVIRMLRCLGVEEEIIEFSRKKHGLAGLLFALRLELMGKKYLIVLDDVWDTDDEYKNFCFRLEEDPGEKCRERLAYGLPKGCGGRVIVTSRSKEVAGQMVGEENLHSLERLSDEDCWDIFKDTIRKGNKSLPGDLESLEWKIKEKCAGVPLAAKMMGEIALDSI